MKQKVFLGIALVLVAGLLSSCSGVKQADLDAALADKTAAQAQVTALQSQLADTKSQLDEANFFFVDVQTKLDAAEAEIATLKGTAVDDGKGPYLSYNPQTFTNTKYGFTFQYNEGWWEQPQVEKGALVTACTVSGGEVPALTVVVLPAATGATLEDVIKTSSFLETVWAFDPVFVNIGDEMTNTYGITATSIEWTTNLGEAVTGMDVVQNSFGFIKDGNWYILNVVNDPINTVGGIPNNAYPDEIFSTWQFTGKTNVTETTTPTTETNPLGFSPATYTDTVNNFTLQHPKLWRDNQLKKGPIKIWLSAPGYNPGAFVSFMPKDTGATLADVLTSKIWLEITYLSNAEIVNIGTDVTNSYGTTATPIITKGYNPPKEDGGPATISHAKAFGFLKGDYWYILTVYNSDAVGTLESAFPDAIFSTWQFTK